MPCMCGGCDRCLRDQGYDIDHDEDRNCLHKRVVRKYGGVACLVCGEILAEPEEDRA